MITKHWFVDNEGIYPQNHPHIQQAANEIRNGEVVAFPTETVYGLGADATNEQAVRKIYEAKGRPSDNPLIVHISEEQMLSSLIAENSITADADKLMKHFWPGPLTIIFPKGENVAPTVTAGLSTVAVRMPDHPIALSLITAVGCGVAAPSANLSGKPSPTKATHVQTDLDGRIAGIVDGGDTGVGVESTVIDCTVTPPMILRPGGVTKEQLEEVIGLVAEDEATKRPNAQEIAPKSPGMKYTHYAPNAPLYLVETEAHLQAIIQNYQSRGQNVGVLTTKETSELLKNHNIVAQYVLGSVEDLTQVATNLYDGLRYFNDFPVDVILATTYSKQGIGQAIMNRLEKASTGTLQK